MPTRPEDNEEERLARIAEIMRQNRDHGDLEARVARARERAEKIREKAMKNWSDPSTSLGAGPPSPIRKKSR